MQVLWPGWPCLTEGYKELGERTAQVIPWSGQRVLVITAFIAVLHLHESYDFKSLQDNKSMFVMKFCSVSWKEYFLICLFFVWILNWLFSFFPCLSPTLLVFLGREKNQTFFFFLLQLYSWDVFLLSKHSLNYTGIFSQFALSKSHLNPSKYCTITSPAVFFAVTLNCTKEKCYKCTDSLAESTDTNYEMLRSLKSSFPPQLGLKWLVLWDPEYQKKFLSFASFCSHTLLLSLLCVIAGWVLQFPNSLKYCIGMQAHHLLHGPKYYSK